MFKRVLGVGGIVMVAIAIAVGINTWGASSDVVTLQSQSAMIDKTETPGAYASNLGDCFAALPSLQGSSDFAAVSCTSDHHWQVVSNGTLALDSFDAAKVQDGANQSCTKTVTAIVKAFSKKQATEYQNARYTALAPSSTSWARGGRTIDCLLGSPTQNYAGSVLK